MSRNRVIAALICASMGMLGCVSNSHQTMPNTQANSVAVLQSKAWVLNYIGATEWVASPHAQRPHLTFSADQRVAGSDGCNRLTGTYLVKKDSLVLSPLAATKMLCPDPNNTAQQFTDALNQVSHFQAYQHTLRLMDQYGNVVLQFERLK